MKLIFIRHAEPDYEHNTVTEKGKREAMILAERVKDFENIKEIYVSPLGRALDTAAPCLQKLGRTAETVEWLKEFGIKVKTFDGKDQNIPWDYLPSQWTEDPLFYDKDNWHRSKVFEGSGIKEYYDRVCRSLDAVLEKNGYKRDKNIYLTETVNSDLHKLTYQVNDGHKGLTYQVNNDVILFFCHLGVSFVMLSHLLGIAPTVLWHTVFVAPASITILGAEEREAGKAFFRVQTIGDASHLLHAGEPISRSGYFTDTYQF